MVTKTKQSKHLNNQPIANLEPFCKDIPNNQSKENDKENIVITLRLFLQLDPS